MPATTLMPLPKQQYFTALGTPLVGGKIYTYAAGGTSPKPTYTDSEATTPQANPIVLNVRGEPPSPIFWSGNYRVEIRDILGNLVYSVDNYNTDPNETGQFLSDFAASSGSSLVGFIAAGAGAVLRTVQNKLRDTINVLDYGAKGDGVTDDTVAIQRAINAAPPNGVVDFPAGSFLLSATLTTPYNMWLRGSGCNSTIFRRQTDYGHTVDMATAGASKVSGIWMYHGTAHVPGDTALTNRVTSATGHLRISKGQQVVVEDCWFWRMPYQIIIDDASLVKIRRCNAQGTWDDRNAALQEGIASVIIGRSAYTQIVVLEDNYFGGSGSAAESMTWTSSDTGAHVFTGISRNIGNQYAVQVKRCEDLLMANNYMGGNNVACFSGYLSPGSVNLDWRISNNFIDAARLSLLEILTEADGIGVNGVTISNNVFNGEMQTLNGITFYNPLFTSAVVTNFTISGNVFQALVGAPMLMYSAQGGVVSGNSLTGYNARQVSLGGDATYAAGIVTNQSTGYMHLVGNSFGGNVNGGGGSSFCYLGHYRVGGANKVTEAGSIFNSCGVGGNQFGRVDMQITTVTAGNYQMRHSDEVIIVKRAIPVVLQIIPPGLVPVGYKFTLKDGAGDAGTASVSFFGTVDGVLNPNFATAYFSKTLLWNGTQWNVIG